MRTKLCAIAAACCVSFSQSAPAGTYTLTPNEWFHINEDPGGLAEIFLWDNTPPLPKFELTPETSAYYIISLNVFSLYADGSVRPTEAIAPGVFGDGELFNRGSNCCGGTFHQQLRLIVPLDGIVGFLITERLVDSLNATVDYQVTVSGVTATTPLPGAVWLFGSILALAAFAKRRQALKATYL